MIGQTLLHYRITDRAGGMGEVYRATDTNLNRDVAIKVLPPEVAQDAERLGCFRREAQLLADKYSVTKGGQRFLVMTPAEERVWRVNVVLNWPALLKD